MCRDWNPERREEIARVIERYATIGKRKCITILSKEFNITRGKIIYMIKTKYLGTVKKNKETRILVLKSKV